MRLYVFPLLSLPDEFEITDVVATGLWNHGGYFLCVDAHGSPSLFLWFSCEELYDNKVQSNILVIV
jgi:hypothetical protein